MSAVGCTLQELLQGKGLDELLDLYRDEIACQTYNSWWSHFDPKVLRAEIDRRIATPAIAVAAVDGREAAAKLMKLADSYARSYRPELKFGNEYRESRRILEAAVLAALTPSPGAAGDEPSA